MIEKRLGVAGPASESNGYIQRPRHVFSVRPISSSHLRLDAAGGLDGACPSCASVHPREVVKVSGTTPPP
jgi:hypothetical protein